MIAGEDDKRGTRARSVHDRLQQWSELRVRRRHLAEIRRIAVPGRVWLWRRVRKVGLVQVQPDEPWVGGGHVGDPLQRRGDRVGAAPFGHPKRHVRLAFWKAIVVDVEPARQPEPSVERKYDDESRRPIAALLQDSSLPVYDRR